MDRITAAAQSVADLTIKTVLDVGCRDGGLKRVLPKHIHYSGCDLVSGEDVRYVGDVRTIEIRETFDCVFALDVLEHVDHLHGLFDRLVGLTHQLLVVSLPNCYDLKGRAMFALRGRLGGKYVLSGMPTIDRHRWIMGYDEIRRFYAAKAAQHGLDLTVRDLRYGDTDRWTLTSVLGVASRVLGPRLTCSSVLGTFRRLGSMGGSDGVTGWAGR